MNIMLKFCTYTWVDKFFKSRLICIHVFNLKLWLSRTYNYNIGMKSKVIVNFICIQCSSYD
jgi:hypothetical protein